MSDRIEVWEYEGGSLFQEVVVIEAGKAKVPENTMAMLLIKAGYERVNSFDYE